MPRPSLTDEEPLVKREQHVTPGKINWHRWNVEAAPDGGLYICQGDHTRSEGCQWEEYVPKSRLSALEQELEALRFFADLGARAAQALPPFALPCSSEYVNAQTGYTGETGG